MLESLRSSISFGVSDQLHGWQGVVVELVHEGRHHYRLLTPGSAARSLARWLAEAVTGDRLGPPAPQACLVVLQRGRTAVDARAVGATMDATMGGGWPVRICGAAAAACCNPSCPALI